MYKKNSLKCFITERVGFIDQDDYTYNEGIGQFINNDVDFSRYQEGQQIDFHHKNLNYTRDPYSARTSQSGNSVHPQHPQVTLFPSIPYCLDPPPTYPGPYPGGDAAHRQLISQPLAETEVVDQDYYLPSYDEAIGRFFNYDVDSSRN